MSKVIKTIWKLIKRHWVRLAEIGVVVWAINGMYGVRHSTTGRHLLPSLSERSDPAHIGPLLFYFLSAVLILYLLRKYERKN